MYNLEANQLYPSKHSQNYSASIMLQWVVGIHTALQVVQICAFSAFQRYTQPMFSYTFVNLHTYELLNSAFTEKSLFSKFVTL